MKKLSFSKWLICIAMVHFSFISIQGNCQSAKQLERERKEKEAAEQAEQARILAIQNQVDAYPDQGITGANHQKFLGKIVFTDHRVPLDSVNLPGVVFRDNFNLGENVYGRMFLDKALIKHLLRNGVKNNFDVGGPFGNRSKASAILYIDGVRALKEQQALIWKTYLIDRVEGKYPSTLQLTVFPNADDNGTPAAFIPVLNALEPGKHIVRIEAYGGYAYDPATSECTPQPVATGEFTLVVTEKGKAKMGLAFDDLKAGMSDPALEAKMVGAIKEMGWQEVPKRAKIESKEWFIKRHPVSGAIISRSIAGWVYSVWPDGHCGFQDFTFIEQYDGTKFTGRLSRESTGTQKVCDCDE
ncbi:MAG: hypothetical protein U0176_18605 [Bacteroidia bacterium]